MTETRKAHGAMARMWIPLTTLFAKGVFVAR
jgi:hypothetical protein